MKKRNKKEELKKKIQNVLDKNLSESINKKGLDELIAEVSIYHQELEYQNDELLRIQRELEESKNHFTSLFDNAPVSYVVYDSEHNIKSFNKSFLKIVNQTSAKLKNRKITDFIHPDSQDQFYFYIKEITKNNKDSGIIINLNVNNELIPVKVHSNTFSSKGELLVRTAVFDISNEKKIEYDLQLSRKKYIDFIENSSEGIYLLEYKKPIDITLPLKNQIEQILTLGIITECNDAMLKMYGLKEKEELIGKSLLDLYGSRIIEENYNSTKEFIESGYIVRDSLTVEYDIDKNLKYFLNNADGIIKDGKLIANWGIQRDITEQRKIEEVIKKNNKLFSSVLEHTQDGIIGLDVNGLHSFINPAAQKMLGFTEEELVGIKSHDTWHYKHHNGSPYNENECPVFISIKEGKEFNGEEIFSRKDGSVFWAEISCSPIFEDNKPAGAVITFRDISERKQTEEKLKISDRVFNHALDMLCIAGFDGYFKVLNPAWSKTLGWSSEELLLKPWNDFVHPADRDSTTNIKKVLVDGKEVYQFENRYICKDGSIKWLSWNSFPYPEEQILFGVARDVTESKKRETILRNFFEQPLNLNLIADFEGNILKINKSWETHLGYRTNELLGRQFFDFIHPDDKTATEKEMKKLGKGITTFHFENRYRHKDGHYKYFVWSAISSVEENHVYAVATDITERKMAEDALVISEEKFKNLFNSINDPVYVHDTDGRFFAVNKAAQEKLGYSIEEFLNMKIPEVDGDFSVERVTKTIHKLLEDGQLLFEGVHKTKEGELFPVEIHSTVVEFEGVKAIVSLARDISERKKTEAIIAEESLRRKILIDESSDGVVILDNTGKVYESNKKFSQMLGYNEVEINQLYVWNWDTKFDKKELKNMITELDEKGDHFESVHKRKDGTTYDVEISSNAAIINGKKLIFCVCRDITERKFAEETIRKSEEKFKTLFEKAADAIFIAETESGIILDANDAALNLMKLPKEKIIGMHQSELHPRESKEYATNTFKKHIEVTRQKDYPVPIENFVVGSDGSIVPVEIMASQIEYLGKKSLLGTFRDITERKKAEEILQESEAKYRLLFESNPHPMFVYDVETLSFLAVNNVAIIKYGYSKDEFLGMTIKDIRPKDDIDRLLINVQNLDTGLDEAGEWKHCLKDGRIIDVEITSHVINFEGRNAEIVLALDITKRKLSEKAIRESEEKFRSLVLSINDVVYTLDKELRYTGVYGSWVERSGLTPDFFIGKSFTDIFGAENFAVHEEANLKALSGNSTVYEWSLPSETGVKHYQTSLTPLYDKDGEISGIVGVARDITFLKESEEKITTALKEKEVLLKEVHHRVKNNFQLINNMLSLESDLITDEKVLTIFNDVQNRIKSLSLTHEILYSTSNFASISFYDYVKRLTDYLQRSFFKSSQKIEILLDIEDASFDPDTIIPCGIIINELVTNSAKYAFSQGANGIIKVSLKKLKDKHILTISDNGVGLHKDFDIDKTDSFGLYLVKALTQQIEGEIKVQSSDKGSTFIITF